MDAEAHPASPEEFLAHAERLRALARRLVHDDARADDLVQEAWLEAQRRPRASIGNLGSWLAGVLRNLAREERRGSARRTRREGASARQEALPSTADVVERIEGFRDVAREVQTLAEPYRTTIVRLYFDGLTAEELAAREGVPSATIRSRHLRALQELRRRLDERPGGRAAWVALLLPELGEHTPATSLRLLPWFLGVLLVALGAFVAWKTTLQSPTAPDVDLATRAQSTRPDAPRADTPPADEPRDRSAATTEDGAFPVDLVLVDARTRAPVADFALVVSDDAGAREELVSDELGRVRGAHAFAPGELALRLVDEPRLAAWRERRMADRNLPWIVNESHARGAGPRELALDVGPTFELGLSGAVPPDFDALVARLFASSPDAPVPESRAPIRRGPRGAWVRFSNEARALAGPAPWRFELQSDFAGASVDVASLEGGARLALVFEPRAALDVELVDEDGAPLFASVESVDAHGDRRALALTARGRGSIGGLAVGPCTLVARELAHAPARATLDLVAGQCARTRLVLARRAVAGSIAGELRVDGRLVQSASIVLAPRDAPELARRVEFTTDASGAKERVPFAFDGLPDGEYVLRARVPGVHRWSANGLVVRPGASGLLLLADAASPARDLVLRAFDAETGAPIVHVQARVDVDANLPTGTLGDPRSTRRSAILVARVPLGAAIAWTIASEGYVPAFGDERAFEDEGDHRVVRAKLARGFGRRVVVLDTEGHPVARARVAATAQGAAETDAGGVAWITAPATPRTLTIEHAGLRREVDVRTLESDGLATWTVRL